MKIKWKKQGDSADRRNFLSLLFFWIFTFLAYFPLKRTGAIFGIQEASAATITTSALNPDYQTEYNNVLAKVQGIQNSNIKYISFVAFTDCHYDSTHPELTRMFDAISLLCQNLDIEFVVDIGDSIDIGSDISDFETFVTEAKNRIDKTLIMLEGNHDTLNTWYSHNYFTLLSKDKLQQDFSYGNYYFMDSPTANVRYIFLNGCDKGSDVDSGTSTRGSNFAGISYRQFSWLANIALKTKRTVVLFCHYSLKQTSSGMITSTDSNYSNIHTLLQKFIAGTSGSIPYTIDYPENGAGTTINYDFTAQGPGAIVVNFCGHIHGDYNASTGSFMEVWIDNALSQTSCYSSLAIDNVKTPNTVDEIAFDVVTLDFTNHKIYCHRFGTGSDRQIDYITGSTQTTGSTGTTVVPTGTGVIVSDSFNRTNNNTTMGNTETGQTWVPASGVWGIINNQAYIVSGGPCSTVVDSKISDALVSVTFATVSNWITLLVRYADNNNFIRINNESGKYRLSKKVAGGSYTDLAPLSTQSVGAGDMVKVYLKGSTIQVYVNGVKIFDVSETFNQTSTKFGIRASDSDSHFDDFKVESV